MSEPVVWEDLPSTATPLNADTLNAMQAYVGTQAAAAASSAADAAASAEAAAAPADDQIATLIQNPASATRGQTDALYSAPATAPMLAGYVIDSGSDLNEAVAQVVASELDQRIATKRAISLSRLPSNAVGMFSYNGAAHIQDNVTTFNGKQYAVWWDNSQQPTIGVKTLPDGLWAVFNLGSISGNPLAAPVPGDGHNVLVVAVDADGYIHVWGNMHNNPMRYVRSTSPENITAWTTPVMVGTDETSVTYPCPVRLSTGELVFVYRSGVSGAGDWFMNRYSTTSKTWTRVGTIFDGLSSGESAYPNHWSPTPDGGIASFFTWRGTGLANTNNDLAYVVLYPNGTAKRASGATQALPVSHANCDIVIDTASTDSGIINTQGFDIDADGRPHGTTWLYDGSGNTQIVHAWWNGSAWQSETVTQLTRRIDTAVSALDPYMSRSQVVCPSQGGTYVLYRCSYGGKDNQVRMIDVTPGRTRIEFPIVDIDLGDWEPTIDTTALKERNELSMLMIPLIANGSGSLTRPYNGVDNWYQQLVLHTTIDLNQIDAFRAGTVRLPHIKTILIRTGPQAGASITASTAADFGFGAAAYTVEGGQTILARYHVRMSAAASTTVTANLRVQRDSPTSATATWATTTATAPSGSYYGRTPWILVAQFASDGDAGFFTMYASKTGPGTASVSAVSLEVGRLVGLTS